MSQWTSSVTKISPKLNQELVLGWHAYRVIRFQLLLLAALETVKLLWVLSPLFNSNRSCFVAKLKKALRFMQDPMPRVTVQDSRGIGDLDAT